MIPTRVSRWLLSALLLLPCLVEHGCISGRAAPSARSIARPALPARIVEAEACEPANTPEPGTTISLEEAQRLALEHNKAYQAILQGTEAARGRTLAAQSGRLPTIALQGGYTRLDDDADDFPNSVGSLDHYATALCVTQPLYRGGAIRAERQAAQLYAKAALQRIRKAAEDTLYAVSHEYYAALLAQRLLAVKEEALASAQAHFDEVTRKHACGAATKYNVLRARVDVSLYEAEVLQQQNALNLVKSSLLQAIGIEQGRTIELSDGLVYQPFEGGPEEALDRASHERADLALARNTIALQEHAIVKVQSRYHPQVTAFATQAWGRPKPLAPADDAWGDERTFGIALEWPLFDGLRREGALIEERAILRRRSFELRHAQERAELEVRQAILSIRDAEDLVASQQMNLAHAQEGLRLAEVGYREGANTEVDITDARAALTRARGLHYQAICDHCMARLMLSKATGTLAGTDAGCPAPPPVVEPRHPEPEKP